MSKGCGPNARGRNPFYLGFRNAALPEPNQNRSRISEVGFAVVCEFISLFWCHGQPKRVSEFSSESSGSDSRHGHSWNAVFE